MGSMVQCALASWPLNSTQPFPQPLTRMPRQAAYALLAIILSSCLPTAFAVNPESPEVRKLIDQGFEFLEENTDKRLGGRCLIALAFHKERVSLNHPRILEAIEACQAVGDQELAKLDNYSNGLAIIFLAELKSDEYRPLITRYADAMSKKQKKNGGWGYASNSIGDTSQTQYAVLSFWELLQNGFSPNVQSVESCLNWLLRTQSPEGAWGYQGIDPGGMTRVDQEEKTLSMAAAGLGSTMILANVLGLSEMSIGAETVKEESAAPSALRRADTSSSHKARQLSGHSIDKQRLAEAIKGGQVWYENIADVIKGKYPCYTLYSIERYKSFEELLSGNAPPEPKWYQQGYEYLESQQRENGSWGGGSRPPCATAFALLFLMRSTQKSIRANLGEGTLIGGRGLQADLSRMKIDRGRLVAETKTAQVSDLLGLLDGSAPENLEQLLSNPEALRVDRAGPEDSRRLQQIVKSGVPEARILSVRILAQQRNLDHVPTLLYAMTDPDKRVVREARDGIRFISRRLSGFGLPDNFTETERYDVIDKWKRWYRRVRPTAPPLP